MMASKGLGSKWLAYIYQLAILYPARRLSSLPLPSCAASTRFRGRLPLLRRYIPAHNHLYILDTCAWKPLLKRPNSAYGQACSLPR